MVTAAKKLKYPYSLEGSYDQPRQHIKKQRLYFVNKSLSSQGYGFYSSQKQTNKQRNWIDISQRRQMNDWQVLDIINHWENAN